MKRLTAEVVGVVPMAGYATRLAPLPFSKELFPLLLPDGAEDLPVRVVSQHVLGQLRTAGVRRAFLVIRDGKWDIPGYYRDGAARAGMALAYLLARAPYGLPFSLDTAGPFTRGCVVAMGLPDVVLSPPDAFARVIHRYRSTEADLALGLFPWRPPPTNDRIEVDPTGRVVGYHTTNPPPHLTRTWGALAWGPRFAEFLRAETEAWEAEHRRDDEMLISSVLVSALEAGLIMHGVDFPDGSMLDIGTRVGLSRLVDWSAAHKRDASA